MSISELLDRRRYCASCREKELRVLMDGLVADGPRVFHVSGIAGIGKSSLLDMFASAAVDECWSVVRLECTNRKSSPFRRVVSTPPTISPS